MPVHDCRYIQTHTHTHTQCLCSNMKPDVIMAMFLLEKWLSKFRTSRPFNDLQALIAADIDPSRWECEKTLRVILDAQDPTGHFGGSGGTIQILPVLSNRHHGSLAEMEQDCPVEDGQYFMSAVPVAYQTFRMQYKNTFTPPPLPINLLTCKCKTKHSEPTHPLPTANMQ